MSGGQIEQDTSHLTINALRSIRLIVYFFRFFVLTLTVNFHSTCRPVLASPACLRTTSYSTTAKTTMRLLPSLSSIAGGEGHSEGGCAVCTTGTVGVAVAVG